MIKNLQSFSQALLAREPSMALIMASDREDQKKALSFFKKKSFSLSMEGATFSKEQFTQESEQVDLFSKKKYILIEEAHLLRKEACTLIGSYLEKPNPHITLILVASDHLSSTKIVQKIEKGGLVLTLLEEKIWDKKARLVHETIRYLKEHGIAIEAKLSAQFIESQGMDQSTIRQELDKLICFMGEKNQVSQEDLIALAPVATPHTVWNLVDAIFQRNSAGALSIGTQLLIDDSLFSLLAILRGQMKNGIEILSLYKEQGKEGVTKRYPYLKGALLEKKLALLEGYGLDSFAATPSIFYDSELQLRDGNREETLILELLLIRLCRC